jgi:hypothetical protein
MEMTPERERSLQRDKRFESEHTDLEEFGLRYDPAKSVSSGKRL